MASSSRWVQHAHQPATHAQYLHAAYLLNDVGAAHHLHGQYETAMDIYSQSLRLRGEAIDAAVAAARDAQRNALEGAEGREEQGGRTREEMEGYIGQLGTFLADADEQGDGAAEVQLIEAEEADQDRVEDGDCESERRIKLFRLPMRITPRPASKSPGSNAEAGSPIWSTVATRFSPNSSSDASSVTLHNMSLLHLRLEDLDRAAQCSAMAADALDEGTDTELCRAVVLSNRAFLHAKLEEREKSTAANEAFEEVAKLALLSIQDGRAAREAAAGVILNAVANFLGEGRIDDALDLCSHVCQGFPLESPASSGSSFASGTTSRSPSQDFPRDHSVSATSSDSRTRIAKRAHVLLALGLHAAGARLYHCSDLRSALQPLARALYLRSSILGETHKSTAQTTYLLGRLLHDREEYVDALGMYERAMAAQIGIATLAQRTASGPSPGAAAPQGGASEVSDLLNTMTNASKVHLVRGSLSEAMTLCSDALELSRSRFLAGEYHLSEFIVVLLHMKGSISQEMGRSGEAVECFSEAVRIARLTSEEGEGQRTLPPLINMGGVKNADACQGAAAA